MKKIEMYTSDTCPNCTKLKEYLNQNNIEYIEYNISKSSEHKRNLIKEGFLSVPVMKFKFRYNIDRIFMGNKRIYKLPIKIIIN